MPFQNRPFEFLYFGSFEFGIDLVLENFEGRIDIELVQKKACLPNIIPFLPPICKPEIRLVKRTAKAKVGRLEFEGDADMGVKNRALDLKNLKFTIDGKDFNFEK